MNAAPLAAAARWAAGGLLGPLAAAAVGGLLGRGLTWAVGGLLASDVLAGDGGDASTGVGWSTAGRGPATASPRLHRMIEVAAIIVAVGLWWWEVRVGGLSPAMAVAPAPGDHAGTVEALSLAARWGAHLALFALLAAAAWIDLRHRVIPDCVTVPGVLAGLTCVWAWPDVLLPVACEVPRSFAPPLVEADVLGLFGGLRTMPGVSWLGPRPHLPGLLASLGIFAAWWGVCTSPLLEPRQDEAGARRNAAWGRLLEPRNAILAVGLAAIGGAWAMGGDRFVAMQSSLAGVLVSGGIVWLVRAGASRALGREAMGMGDVTLMAMVGAWLGWQACLIAFFLAAFIGLAHGGLQFFRHRENELPYGPSLCLASAAVVVGWRPLWDRVGGYFAEPVELAFAVLGVVALTALTLFCWQRLRDARFGG